MRVNARFRILCNALGKGGRLFRPLIFSTTAAMLIAPVAIEEATAQDAALQTFHAMVIQRVILQAHAFVGLKIGRGECTDYVDLVLKTAFAQPGKNYVWGAPTPPDKIEAGDIIQFWNTKFTGPNGAAWGTNDKHTAIVVNVSGPQVTLMHQNFPYGSPVVKGVYDLSWPHTGTYDVYRPVSQ